MKKLGRYSIFLALGLILSACNQINSTPLNTINSEFQSVISSGNNTLVSKNNSNQFSNGDSQDPSISNDGRFVVFTSRATNLSDLTATNGSENVYLYDFLEDKITSITVFNENSGISNQAVISGNGNYIAFASNDRSLQPNSDFVRQNIYLYNRDNETFVTASVDDNGNPIRSPNGFGGANYPSISYDGRFVVFQSDYDHISGISGAPYGIYLFDSQTGRTSGITVNENLIGNNNSVSPVISADGSKIAFTSAASNLVPNDTNGQDDVFLYDVATESISLISKSSSGLLANARSSEPAITADGRFVTFQSDATNLVGNDNDGFLDIYVYDVVNDETKLISQNMQGVTGDRNSQFPDISSDGRYIVFESRATNLGSKNQRRSIFLFDQVEQSLEVVSLNGTTFEERSFNSQKATINADGSKVAYYSNDSLLVDGDNNGRNDIFVTQLAIPLSCDEGFYQDGGSCVAAPAGSFVPEGGNEPILCPLGTYQPDEGQTQCLSAPAGTFVTVVGSIESTLCPAGTYQPDEGQVECLAADIDFFVDTEGATSQTPCPVGTSQPLVGQAFCIADEVDSTPPVIEVSFSGTQGNNDWYTSDVTVSFTVSDAESGVTSESADCAGATVSTDTSGTTFTCEATSAGGTSTESVTIKLDKTIPVVSASPSVAANAAGWHNTDVTVSYACDASLADLDASASDLADDVLAASGTASGTCVDLAGNSASASYTAQIDKQVPVISSSFTNQAWFNATVDVPFSCTDAGESGLAVNSVAGLSLSSEGANQSATNTGECIDNAGNTAEALSIININIDLTAPVVTATPTPPANAAGWNNTDVTVSFDGTDGLSGIASCDADVVLSSDGIDQSATGSCVDAAGNSASATASGIKIDKAAPVVSIQGVNEGATYTLGSVPTATCSTTDAVSGVATNASLSTTGATVGTFTATCSGAVDNAGNAGNTVSVSYSVVYDFDGFFNPIKSGVNSQKAGSSVPVKFSLGGNQGLDIIDSIVSKEVNCSTGAELGNVEAASSNSGLKYSGNQYNYVWKTDKAYKNQCRELVLTLNDGTSHTANFKFK